MHRGRGRPPNSHKRTLSNLSATSTSQEDTGTSGAAATGAGAAHSKEGGGFGTPSSAAAESQRSGTSGTLANVVASNTHKAAGVDNALIIVNKSTRRVFTASECDTLEQVRNWAPLSDLERVYQALTRQKLSLLER